MRRKRLDGLLLHLGNALVTLALLFGGLEAFLSAHAYGYSWRCAPWPPAWPWGSTPGGTGAGPSWGSWPY